MDTDTTGMSTPGLRMKEPWGRTAEAEKEHDQGGSSWDSDPPCRDGVHGWLFCRFNPVRRRKSCWEGLTQPS